MYFARDTTSRKENLIFVFILLVLVCLFCRQFWISPAKPGKDLNFVNCDFHKPARTIEPVNSNAFLDLTGDGSTNLVVSSRQADSKVFEVWQVCRVELSFHCYVSLEYYVLGA